MKRKVILCRSKLLISLLLVIAFTVSCGESGPYVEIAGDRYAEDDLKKELPEYYKEIRRDYNHQIKRALERLAEKKMFELASKEKGFKTSEEYVRSIEANIPVPSDAEVQTTYNTLKAQGQIRGKSIEQMRGQIISYVRSQKARETLSIARSQLKSKYKYREGPENRKKIDINGEPAILPKSGTAKVTVVEFSGYECPFCKKVQDTTSKIRAKYGDKVKWVMKDYPLNIGSIYSHTAANCVFSQNTNNYWKIFDILFSEKYGREILQKENLDKKVEELGTDMDEFAKCTQSTSVRDEILADHKEGVSLGVRGIPHFFVNGKPLSGAQPFSVFDSFISNELKK